MSSFPKIAGYTGTFSGSPVTVNPQADYGWVSYQIVVAPLGSHTVYFSTPGVTIPIPSGAALSIPGPVGQFTLTGTSGNSYLAYCAAEANAFDLYIAGSGGGGGGGAPTSAPYLLDDTVVGTLTNAVAIQDLPATLKFIKQAASASAPAAPLAVYGAHLADPATIGGGVKLQMRQINGDGDMSMARLTAAWDDVTNPAQPVSNLTLDLGEQQIEALSVSLQGNATIVQAPGRDAQFKASGSGCAAVLWADDATGGVSLIAGTGVLQKVVTLDAATGALSVTNGQIKQVADATDSTDAPNLAQVQALVAPKEYLRWGGTQLGTPGGGSVYPYVGYSTSAPSTSNRQLQMVAAGTITKMVVNVVTFSLFGGDCTVILGRGGLTLLTTAPLASTGFATVTGAVAVSDGDDLYVEVVSSGAVVANNLEIVVYVEISH